MQVMSPAALGVINIFTCQFKPRIELARNVSDSMGAKSGSMIHFLCLFLLPAKL